VTWETEIQSFQITTKALEETEGTESSGGGGSSGHAQGGKAGHVVHRVVDH
jgi:hypothetical protein